MRLYVEGNNDTKVYLSINAKDRDELYFKLGYKDSFTIASLQKNIFQVKAETDWKQQYFNTIFFAFFGLAFGPFGVLIGGSIGFLIGGIKDSEEQEKVDYFNQSSYTEVEVINEKKS